MSSPRSASIVLLDLVLAVALVVLCATIGAQALDSARKREELHVVCAEARSLHEGFRRYHEKNRAFPEPAAPRASESGVLETLRRRGYYAGELTQYLMDGRVDAYDVPRDDGKGREYWLEMTLSGEPALRLLVARSDDAPLGRGKWLDGSFLFRDGKIEPL